MNGNSQGNFNTYVAERHLRVQSDVEDQDVVSYIFAAASATDLPGQLGAELVDMVRTPLLEMTLAEQHERIVDDLCVGTCHWK